MKRRTFIQTILAAVAALFTPRTAGALPGPDSPGEPAGPVPGGPGAQDGPDLTRTWTATEPPDPYFFHPGEIWIQVGGEPEKITFTDGATWGPPAISAEPIDAMIRSSIRERWMDSAMVATQKLAPPGKRKK